MRQFDVLRNPNPETASWAPYLLVLQNDLLRDLRTTVVAPLVRQAHFGRPAQVLNPVFEIRGEPLVLSTAELAGVSAPMLGETVASLAGRRTKIIAAIDLLFTGI
jgi:toxin CcdB